MKPKIVKPMLMSLILGLSALFSPSLSLAQTAAVEAPKAAETIHATPPMWVLKDNDSTIYFLGSFHLLKPNVDWHSANVNMAYKAADSVWFETTEIEDKALAMSLFQKYGVDASANVTDGLSEAEAAKLDTQLKSMGYSAAMFKPLRKWAVGLTMLQTVLVKEGFVVDNGVDISLMKQARADNKPVLGFETLDQQFQAIVPPTPEVETQELLQTMEELDKGAEYLNSMMAEWVAGAPNGLTMIEEMKSETPDSYERLLVKRNQNWVPQIEGVLAAKGTVLVVVGAGHLVGDDSVIAMLKAKGYKLERLK